MSENGYPETAIDKGKGSPPSFSSSLGYLANGFVLQNRASPEPSCLEYQFLFEDPNGLQVNISYIVAHLHPQA